MSGIEQSIQACFDNARGLLRAAKRSSAQFRQHDLCVAAHARM
jgi:hypothetical protein